MTREIGIPNNDVAGAFDALRQLLGRADAMLCATEDLLDRAEDGSDGRRRGEHLAHLLGAAKEAVQAAMHAGGPIAAELAKHRDEHMTNRAPSGDVARAAQSQAKKR